ncbi:transposase [Streptomyces sp. x-80]|uniref:transposase n=1 Tax=Streptomyces sp. x-80 TaxID=2789282 RepID=UPI00397F3413
MLIKVVFRSWNGTWRSAGTTSGRGWSRDDQWSWLEPLLPPIPKTGRPPRDRRQCFDGIRWRARTGPPWRDIPERYGPREAAYTLFRRRQIDGTWTLVLKKLQVTADAAGHIEWEVSVDSTVCQAPARR